MKANRALSYAVASLFLGWCVFAFRAVILQVKFGPVWAARDAVFIAALLSLANYAIRVTRWSFYLARLGHPLPVAFSGLTYIAGFAFTLSPGKVGEMVRGRYYQKIGIPLSSTAAAFFIERLMDLLAMLALGFFALASTSAYDGLLWGTVTFIVSLLAVLALAPWERVSGWMETAPFFSNPLKRAALPLLRTLLSAKALLQPKLLISGFVLGLVAWGAEGTGLMVIGAISPDISIGWAAATGIYSVAIIVGALSFLPGGLGSTEAVMIALLAAHGYPMPDAILMTLVCRLLTLWLAGVIGWIAVAILRHNNLLENISQ